MTQRDQLIWGMLELDGYKVVVVQSRHLDNPQPGRKHLRNIAEAMAYRLCHLHSDFSEINNCGTR